MAWTDPIAAPAVTGAVAPASLWNTYLVDNLRALKDPASVHHIGATPFERWYPLGVKDAVSATVANNTSNILLSYPFVLSRAASIDRLSFNCTTLVASSFGRCGIYQATSETNLYPLNLVVDGGSISTATTGVKTATVATNLSPNVVYWACYVSTLAPAVRAYANSTTVSGLFPMLGVSTSMAAAEAFMLKPAFTYAALPSTYPVGATPTTDDTVMIAARFSA